MKTKNANIPNEEIIRMLNMDAKVLVNAYAALQSALVTVVGTKNSEFMYDVFNNIVSLFAKEMGLTSLSNAELVYSPTYEECAAVVDARLRAVNFLTSLVLGSFLEESVLDLFFDKLEKLAEQQKETIRSLLSEEKEKNVH